jgi:hypothetical protein
VVGRVLEVLLQGLSYNTRLIDETDAGTLEEVLGGVQLLLATPTVNTESRARFLDSLRSTPGTATIPVLTLSTAPKTDPADQAGLVLWPCRLEDLRTEIEAALITAGGANEPGGPDPCSSPEEPAAAGPPADSLASTADPQGPREDVAINGFSPPASGGPDI